jgi:uncharacterized protein YndB with AHSA1/START domain
MNEVEERMSSFQLAQEVTIGASRRRVWRALTREIDSWWRFRQGGDESTITLDPSLGGQFAERWGEEAGAVWGVVLFVEPPRVIRLSGPLGMHTADSNLYSFELEEKSASETVVKITHHAVGYLDPKWEASYGEGWNTLLGTYLKSYAETDATWRDVDQEKPDA